MYLYARLFGIATYLIVLGLTLWLLRRFHSEQSGYILFLFWSLLCIMAYFYAPAPQSDLYRIQQWTENYAKYTWDRIWSELNAGNGSLVAQIVLYKILGMTGNKGLIATTSCSICFGIIIYVINAIQKRYALTGACVAAVILWFMSADYYMTTIATIRSYLAAALVFLCIYREAARGKTDFVNIILYMIAAFMHRIGIVLIGIRIIAMLLYRREKRSLRIIALAVMLLVSYPLYRGLLSSSMATFESYTFSTTYSYIFERMILTIMLGLQIYTLIEYSRYNQIEDHFMNEMYSVYKFCVIALVPSMIQFTIFMRLSYFTSLLAIPFVMQNNSDVECEKGVWSVNIITSCSIVMLLLTCSRGYLCSLKFW